MESWTEMTKMDDAALSARLRRCARTEKLGGRWASSAPWRDCFS